MIEPGFVRQLLERRAFNEIEEGDRLHGDVTRSGVHRVCRRDGALAQRPDAQVVALDAVLVGEAHRVAQDTAELLAVEVLAEEGVRRKNESQLTRRRRHRRPIQLHPQGGAERLPHDLLAVRVAVERVDEDGVAAEGAIDGHAEHLGRPHLGNLLLDLRRPLNEAQPRRTGTGAELVHLVQQDAGRLLHQLAGHVDGDQAPNKHVVPLDVIGDGIPRVPLGLRDAHLRRECDHVAVVDDTPVPPPLDPCASTHIPTGQ